jgi:hypothetical protein
MSKKKENPSLHGAEHRLQPFALPPDSRLRMRHQRSPAARLNDLLFEVVTRVAPHVAYSFVPKSRAALHTFARAGRGAGTRGETKSQVTRCPYLSEQASIAAERLRNPSLLHLPRTSDSLASLLVRQSNGTPPVPPSATRPGQGLAGDCGLACGAHDIRGPVLKTGPYPPDQPAGYRHNGALLAPGGRDPVEDHGEGVVAR